MCQDLDNKILDVGSFYFVSLLVWAYSVIMSWDNDTLQHV